MSVSPPACPSSPTSLRTDPLWRAPLIPLAAAYTAGIVLDRTSPVPAVAALAAVAVGLVAWLLSWHGKAPSSAPLYLWIAAAAFGAAYHHVRVRLVASDDIGGVAAAEPRPAHLRGVLDEEPHVSLQPPDDGLGSFARGDVTLTTLAVAEVLTPDGWAPASGRVRLHLVGRLTGLHAGDEVDIVGRLALPQPPANPGGFDYAAHLRDRGVSAVLDVRAPDDGAVVRLAERWPRSARGLLAMARGRCRGVLESTIPPGRVRSLAVALLLGDRSALPAADWDRYVRTGVVHVLVVSGQHLAVLAVSAWFLLRQGGVRGRPGSVVVALLLLFYSLLVGADPPALRSAVTAVAVCGALLLRRQVATANTFALAWLVVGLLDPTDLCSAGCQLSFLNVLLLWRGSRLWPRPSLDALDRLIDEARPAWLRVLRWIGRQVLVAYAVSLGLWLALVPLVAGRFHVVSPAGVLLTPPLVLLTSVALLTGFAMLIVAPLCPPLAVPLAGLTRLALAATDALVDIADAVPGGHRFVGGVPEWWLWVFYGALVGCALLEGARRYLRWLAPAAAAWLCVGFLGGAAPRPSDELRCTFLAVGHGSCAVVETPDGRTFVYDAGAIAGPDVAHRLIAPYLWHRGVRRIDEVFLSHADLDHFNGLPALLDRFAVGQVTWTPTFRSKESAGARVTAAAVARRGVPTRDVNDGDMLTAGDVTLDVLHPPPGDAAGESENARSLVLLIRHAGHAILLTGDLEGPGLARLLSQPSRPVDVLMAPHHGSKTSNTAELAQWATPLAVVSCQGTRDTKEVRRLYEDSRAHFFNTATQGAVTVRSHATGVVIETYRTGERVVLRR